MFKCKQKGSTRINAIQTCNDMYFVKTKILKFLLYQYKHILMNLLTET